YVGVLAIGRAWVANEKLRTAIAKKLANGDPDALPDLRLDALLSALQLIWLFPLLFRQLDLHFHLFDAPADATFLDCLAFTFDSFSKALLDWAQAYGLSVPHPIRYERPSALAGTLLIMKRLTIDYILIQGIVRLFAIRATVKEAVEALRQDP